MNEKFTPGPWRAEGTLVFIGRVGDYADNGAAKWGGFNISRAPNAEANAHLIAAAPDLYAALQSTRKRLYDAMIALGSSPEFADAGCHEADAALAKARGET